MPGPYVESDDVSASVNARLGQSAGAVEPGHWTKIVDKAVHRGYQRILKALVKRGYSIAAIDRWVGRKVYNHDLAAGYATLQRGTVTEAARDALFKEIELLHEDLDDPDLILMDDGGAIIPPDLVDGIAAASGGRLTAFDGALADVERMNGFPIQRPKIAPVPAPRRDWN